MIEEYKKIIDKKILENYLQALIVDVDNDKLYKYVNKDGEFSLESEQSYVEYITNCHDFIYEDNLQDYISSLSISKLESSNSRLDLNYKMLNNKVGTYMEYTNNISLHSEGGNKIIVVLVSLNNGNNVLQHTDQSKSILEAKYNKIIDAVSLAMLKIHNVVNMDNNLRTKDEYINSILAGLTTDYPELNKSFNENASEVYKNGKSSIMIVDDDKITCNLISKIFDKKYDLIIANNGQDAIEALKRSKENSVNISCIFLDLIMPVLDGFSVLDYLNDNNYLNKLPVIIISGNYDKETRNKAYSYQIADMLEKPFNAQVIKHRIDNLISLYNSSGIINEMMLEQHENLRGIINDIVYAYEVDNAVAINSVKRYMKILTMQVSVMYPEYNINSNMIDKMTASIVYYNIGNYMLPKTILSKKTNYSEEEIHAIKEANITGSAIIKHVIANENSEIDAKYAYEIARYHKEHFDGTGYPEGLSGVSIPLSAQIAAIVIEYVNLINSMVPVDYDRVASLIEMEANRKFNPKMVEAFKMVRSEFDAITKVGG